MTLFGNNKEMCILQAINRKINLKNETELTFLKLNSIHVYFSEKNICSMKFLIKLWRNTNCDAKKIREIRVRKSATIL